MGKGKKEIKATTAKTVKVDEWEELCTKGPLTKGTSTMIAKAVALGGTNGLPDVKALTVLFASAQKIKIASVNTGMIFGWKLCSVKGDEVATFKSDSFSATSKGAAGCFENLVWPKP